MDDRTVQQIQPSMHHQQAVQIPPARFTPIYVDHPSPVAVTSSTVTVVTVANPAYQTIYYPQAGSTYQIQQTISGDSLNQQSTEASQPVPVVLVFPQIATFREKMKTLYGFLRLFQVICSATELGLICVVLAMTDYWLYWLFLVAIPVICLLAGSMQLFNPAHAAWDERGGRLDFVLAIACLLQGGLTTCVYYWLNYLVDSSYDVANVSFIIIPAIVFTSVLSIFYWVSAGSAIRYICPSVTGGQRFVRFENSSE